MGISSAHFAPPSVVSVYTWLPSMVAFFSFTEQVSLIIRNIYVTGQAWQNVGRKIRKRFPLLKMILKLIAAPFALHIPHSADCPVLVPF